MNTTLEPEIQKPEQNNSQPLATQEKKDEGKMPILLILGCAVLFSFFLPWLQIKFFATFNLSGFDLQKDGGKTLLLWIVPITSGISIFATLTKKCPAVAGQLAGAAPLSVLAYGLYHDGAALFNVLQFGAFLGLIAGLMLFIASCSLSARYR